MALRFDQRHGEFPLPTQLQPQQITNELAALLWRLFYDLMKSDMREIDYGKAIIHGEWRQFIRQWHVIIEHKRADLFNPDFNLFAERVRTIIYDEGWATLYTFLEFFAKSQKFRRHARSVAAILAHCGAAWRLVDGQIIPVSSPEQAEAVVSAVETVFADGPLGAREHLRSASGAIATQLWGASVRESISAVESVARTLGDAKSLSDALKSLQSAGHHIHPALAKGLNNLYGYTSDESGIRHSLLDEGAAPVTESEAIFMFGACASFCQYLLNVSR